MDVKRMRPRLSVVVCTYNRSDFLKGALQSLAEQSLEKSKYEVIIVDNNSVDQTEEIARSFVEKYPNFRYVKEIKQGLSYARNCGFKKAHGEYVAFIDDDAKAYSDWTEKILRAFETATPKPAAVGGKILPWWEKSPPSWLKGKYETRTWGAKKGFLQPPRARYGFSGSNMAFRKSILELFGGFSPEFGMIGNKPGVGEETALFFRIYPKYPYFWYEPTIRVKHWVPARNMRISHIIKRSYLGGIATEAIREGTSYSSIMNTLLFIVFNSYVLPFRVHWWQRYWQEDFLKQITPIARAFGTLKSLIRKVAKTKIKQEYKN